MSVKAVAIIVAVPLIAAFFVFGRYRHALAAELFEAGRGLGGEDSMSYAEVLEKLSPDDIDYSPFTDRKWLTIPPNDSLFDGEGVLFWGTSTLNFKNGVSSSFPIHIVTIVKDDQIISMRFYYNIQKIQKDLGYTVLPPNDE